MPPYFFHLAFELHNQPANSTTTSSEQGFKSFWPAQNLNIFGTELPVHSVSPWISYLAPKQARRTTPQTASSAPRHNSNQAANCKQPVPHSKENATTSTRDNASGEETITSEEIEGSGEEEVEGGSHDYRFDNLSLQSIDMQPNPTTSDDQVSRSGSNQGTVLQPEAGDVALKGKYVPSDPKNTELGWGVVHLYRDVKPTFALEEEEPTKSALNANPEVDESEAFVDEECTTLCILAVPSYMTPSDLLGWIGEETRDLVSHFRLVRTERSNRYMVLIKFKEAKAAREWQKEANGTLFSSMEPENCHIVFVKSIRFQIPSSNKDPSSFPDMTNDPFTPAFNEADPSTAAANSSFTSKPAPPPTPALVELPTCPVCLERMDDTTGLATIFCQHVFHCACLQKWKGSGCPVCRYTQNDHHLHAAKAELDGSEKECRVCGLSANLWICLICGHVGCGRYDEAHAFAHYEETGHCFAMDLATQHVWDYDGDAYVHRLIQSEADGKLVELPSALARADLDAPLPREKLEKMSFEYTHLLTSQLDSQRAYFEEQIERAADKAARSGAVADEASAAGLAAGQQLAQLQRSHDVLLTETLPGLERDKERAERRAERVEATARRMEKEWREKEVINESLMDRIAHLERQLGEATVRCSDLEEQNRDLSFFISGMEKLRDAGEEVVEGTVVVGEAKGKGRKKGKR